MARVDQQSVCDRELFSELTESPIARQSKCDWELFSELTESPFAQQSVCDRVFIIKKGLKHVLSYPLQRVKKCIYIYKTMD